METIEDIEKNIFAMEYAKNESIEATKESLLIMKEQIMKERKKLKKLKKLKEMKRREKLIN